MNIRSTKKFDQKFEKLPQFIQKAFQKQLGFLLAGNNHPSLHLKKMKGRIDLWECRINKAYRFTFQIMDNIIILRNIGSHDILNQPE